MGVNSPDSFMLLLTETVCIVRQVAIATAANTLSSLFLFHPPFLPPFSNLYRHGLPNFWVGNVQCNRPGNNESQKETFLQEELELQHSFKWPSAVMIADYSGNKLQGCCSHSSLTSNGSLPGADGHRRSVEHRVAGWSTCFERLLQDPVGVRYFSEFLKKEFSEENILFWQACEYFSHVPATDKKQLSQRAGEIYNSFLSSKATMPVNIDSQAQLADDVLTSPQPEMFKTQQLQIFNLMKFDSYSRFLKSSLYLECLRAEEDGQPLPDPYQIPCSPAPSKHSASSDRSTLSTPKKDIRKQRSGKSLNEDTKDESADKKRGIFFSWSRNRSFGKGPKKKDIGDINLDFWGSNGRRESQGSLSSSASLEIPNSAAKLESDNRHSVGAWERSSRHCSVLLPDGSCSSITLRPGASIREVLQDLCRNICVNIAAVDLFLVGGEKPLVLDQDCMTLCSRDLRLEKRTLFRLDLVPINRSVGLKAKPTKPVTEVLRPVVAKYGLNLSDLVAKISGETEPLDLGAPISSLDGLRVVLERADPCSGKEKSKSSSLKGHPPTRSFSAAVSSRDTFYLHTCLVKRVLWRLRTVEEDAHADLTLVGEGDISSPNSTLIPPSPPSFPSLESSLPEANFTPPTPCPPSQDTGGEGKSSSDLNPEAELPPQHAVVFYRALQFT
ncbi:hypothetical protein CCH79_00012981 [Gambusia affinis]|uniref:RGS domain-containing protein n=1 Tax=Gambusia affinis TaxID=33528 RepID=A0A315W012_GAMAF|nr:hypothetical protein CCH79_00012981 [Gambusia affinis]